MSKELEDAFTKAKVALMMNKDLTFITTIFMTLKFVWDDTHPTAWTNGYTIGFNPAFFMSLSKEERVFVLAHEGWHVAFDHLGRLLGRDHKLFNKAADHYINLMQIAMGKNKIGYPMKMPKIGLADDRFIGLSTDEIYHILRQEADSSENGMEDMKLPGNGPGEHQPGTPEYAKHIETLLVRAATQHQIRQGDPNGIPGDIQVMLQKMLKPKLPWQQILRREAQQMVKQAYNWARPNRRYFPDFHLPTAHSRGIKSLTFYVDISGSVEDHQFTQFISEITSVFRMFNMEEVRIVQFDTAIHSIDVVKSFAAIAKLKFTGRGGTDINCICEDIEKTNPQLALVFTDGHFYWPKESIKNRVLWLINDNPKFVPKFGRAIHFETKENQ